jgi:uncharacterized repeat protein (TIGR03803 family)
VIFDSSGNLYGTTTGQFFNGGHGVVFELSPVKGKWKKTVLYRFAGGTDGSDPESGLIMDTLGNLYGTTFYGGTQGIGTVYELSPSALITGWTEKVIYDVGGYAGLTMDAAGNIFGASMSPTFPMVSGVFELSPDGTGGWYPTVIHNFPWCDPSSDPKGDGSCPYGTPVVGPAGNIYGTTSRGGVYGYGTVYKVHPEKDGNWTETILHSFDFWEHGFAPVAGIVMDASGNIYGTTVFGGKYNSGTVFELEAPGHKYKVVWNFNYTDGAQPPSSLILDSSGNLYGTTYQGGLYEVGNVFEVTP